MKTPTLDYAKAIRIKAKYLAAVYHCMAQEDVRYFLNGVHIQRLEGDELMTVEATDGHTLLRLTLNKSDDAYPYCPEGTDVIVSFTKDQWREIKRTKYRDSTLKLMPNDGGAFTDFGYLSPAVGTMVSVVDGTFPDVNKVMPNLNKRTAKPFGVSPAYLDRCNKITNALLPTSARACAVITTVEHVLHWTLSPDTLLRLDEVHALDGVTMGMRYE